MKKNKDVNLNIRITPEIRDELNEVADEMEVPAAQIVREAVREKIDSLQKTHPKLRPEVETA